jgi:hypothetical protein
LNFNLKNKSKKLLIRLKYCYMEILKRAKAFYPTLKVVISPERFYRQELKEFTF